MIRQRKTKKNDEDVSTIFIDDDDYSPPQRKRRGGNKQARWNPMMMMEMKSFVRNIIKNYQTLITYESYMVMLGCLIIIVHIFRGNINTVNIHHSNIKVTSKTLRTMLRNRPPTDHNIPLQIHLFKQIGEKNSFPFHKAPKPIIQSPNVDYGGLKITFLTEDTSSSWQRKIYIDQEEAMSGDVFKKEDFIKHWRKLDTYYAFDDDFIRNDQFGSDSHCRRVSWHRLYNPSCNTMHEIEVISLERSSNKLLGEGSYRSAFFIESIYDNKLVMKLQRFDDKHYEMDRMEFVRMDALIMERLTSSPRIVDIYGHCAFSVLTEFLPEELYGYAVPFQSKTTQTRKINLQKQNNQVTPLNDIDINKKLDIALQMAEAIADLHGFKDGILVHDDIQLPQFLLSGENKIKLNDFNRGEAMLYDEQKGAYCRYRNGPGGGDWRAPEEYADDPLNEKIDVFSFGNNVYSLLTGAFVFYWNHDFKTIKKMIKRGDKQDIDPAYRTRSFIEGKLVNIIEKCWAYKADDRPSIFQVVDELRIVKQEWERFSHQ